MENKITPMKNYTPPQLPTLQASRENPDLLKTLPRRWKKKAALIVGFASVIALTGCGSSAQKAEEIRIQEEQENLRILEEQENLRILEEQERIRIQEEQEILRIQAAQEAFSAALAQLENTELDLYSHRGGAMSGPFYTVYFTEHEVQNFVRAKLEAAGFDFSAHPPDHTVQHIGLRFEIDLFDEEKNVGVSYISQYENSVMMRGERAAQDIAKLFNESHNITVGAFYTPEVFLFDPWKEGFSHYYWEDDFDHAAYEAAKNEAVAERTDDARREMIDNLTEQVENFISQIDN